MKSCATVLFVSFILLLTCPTAVVADEPAATGDALFVVHFSTGPAWNPQLPPNEQTGFQGHSGNLQRLRKEGRIVFGTRYSDLGMIFLKAGDRAAAVEELDNDPGVKAGIFEYRVEKMNVFYPWKESD